MVNVLVSCCLEQCVGAGSAKLAPAVDHDGGAGGKAQRRGTGHDGSATSSGLPMRLSGVVLAARSLKALSRPGTKSVSTTPGDTLSTRISGASARPSDRPSCRALPLPRSTPRAAHAGAPRDGPHVDHQPLARCLQVGAMARIAANWPRQFTANISSISASSNASRSACATALVNPAGYCPLGARLQARRRSAPAQRRAA